MPPPVKHPESAELAERSSGEVVLYRSPEIGDVLRSLGFRILGTLIQRAAEEVAIFFSVRRFGLKRTDKGELYDPLDGPRSW
jgi:hypothetical protein